ncbi:E3 ubiquitin-protein ligase ATL9 [Quercus suber]|uniref:E3 ubiquitin-protein ligase ATL9 n=1 Tax=Quercus suber TaxID=58331 RepID=UPI0032DEDDA6
MQPFSPGNDNAAWSLKIGFPQTAPTDDAVNLTSEIARRLYAQNNLHNRKERTSQRAPVWCRPNTLRRRSFIWRGSNQHGDIMVQRSRKFRAKMISNEDLKKLPCFDYEAAEKGTSCVDCAVCLENFKMGEKCRLLPNCRHSFHVQCIDSWLLKTPICPICRTCIIPLKVEVIISEESSVSDNIAVELT